VLLELKHAEQYKLGGPWGSMQAAPAVSSSIAIQALLSLTMHDVTATAACTLLVAHAAAHHDPFPQTCQQDKK
jgi:hypothetical protein